MKSPWRRRRQQQRSDRCCHRRNGLCRALADAPPRCCSCRACARRPKTKAASPSHPAPCHKRHTVARCSSRLRRRSADAGPASTRAGVAYVRSRRGCNKLRDASRDQQRKCAFVNGRWDVKSNTYATLSPHSHCDVCMAPCPDAPSSMLASADFEQKWMECKVEPHSPAAHAIPHH